MVSLVPDGGCADAQFHLRTQRRRAFGHLSLEGQSLISRQSQRPFFSFKVLRFYADGFYGSDTFDLRRRPEIYRIA